LARNEWVEQDMDGEFDEEQFDTAFDENYEVYDSGCEPPYVSTPQIRSIAVAEVPADKIIALSVTGLGCLNEREVIVAGGRQTVRLYSERSNEDEGGLSVFNFVQLEDMLEEKRPKTAQEAQEAQKKEWFKQAINPLMAQLIQHQKALRESYELKIEDAERKGVSTDEMAAIRAKHWELHHEMEADAMAQGKAMIEEAGYMPEGGWEAAEAAPMSEELAAWRKAEYGDWVERNLASDAEKWVARRNEMVTKWSRTHDKLKGSTLPPDMKKERIDKLEAQFNLAMEEVNAEYFRQGAKKIREAGFEPEGKFAEQEAKDGQATKALLRKKTRTYLRPGQQAPAGSQEAANQAG